MEAVENKQGVSGHFEGKENGNLLCMVWIWNVPCCLVNLNAWYPPCGTILRVVQPYEVGPSCWNRSLGPFEKCSHQRFLASRSQLPSSSPGEEVSPMHPCHHDSYQALPSVMDWYLPNSGAKINLPSHKLFCQVLQCQQRADGCLDLRDSVKPYRKQSQRSEGNRLGNGMQASLRLKKVQTEAMRVQQAVFIVFCGGVRKLLDEL